MIVTRRKLLRIAAPALILPKTALAQVGQLTTWPPKAPLISGGGGNLFTLIAHASGHTASGGASPATTTPNIDTTGANLIVMGAAWYNGGTVTFSDSAGNPSPTLLTVYQSNTASVAAVQMAYWYSPTLSSTHNFTFSSTAACYASVYVSAWGGAAASPFDQQYGNGPVAGNTLIQPGLVTPASNNELIVSICATSNTGSTVPTIDSGFTVSDALAYLASNYFGGGMAYLKQTTAAAVNPTWTFGGTASSGSIAAAIATFK
jgi:hypothetical protein